MQFQNVLDVPLPPPQAWQLLMDIERIAPCLPGAQLTARVDERTYKGNVSVKLGPVALTFAGTAQFEEIDSVGHSARIKASGTDAKGRGGAHAIVRFSLEPVGESTRVLVNTDLNLSGAVAQYGRGVGMIQEVANQLTLEFSRALRAQLAAQAANPATATEAPAAKPISGFGLMLRVLWAKLKRLFSSHAAP